MAIWWMLMFHHETGSTRVCVCVHTVSVMCDDAGSDRFTTCSGTTRQTKSRRRSLLMKSQWLLLLLLVSFKVLQTFSCSGSLNMILSPCSGDIYFDRSTSPLRRKLTFLLLSYYLVSARLSLLLLPHSVLLTSFLLRYLLWFTLTSCKCVREVSPHISLVVLKYLDLIKSKRIKV